MTMQKDAIISKDCLYRYSLERTWDTSKERVLFIMLNPSTADAIKDDATIKKCVGFARRWGYGGITVGNLFALRSRDPHGLLGPHDPVGPKNNSYLEQLAAECPVVVAAWGNSGKKPGLRHLFQERESFTKKLLQGRMQSLGTNKDGTPKHPVLPGYKTPLEPYGAQDDCKVSELDRRGGRWSALGGRRKSWLAGAWIAGLETILPGAGRSDRC